MKEEEVWGMDGGRAETTEQARKDKQDKGQETTRVLSSKRRQPTGDRPGLADDACLIVTSQPSHGVVHNRCNLRQHKTYVAHKIG